MGRKGFLGSVIRFFFFFGLKPRGNTQKNEKKGRKKMVFVNPVPSRWAIQKKKLEREKEKGKR